MVETTWPSAQRAAARRLAAAAVHEGLAACVHLSARTESIYRWHGTLVRDREYVVRFTSGAYVASRLVSRILDVHPYEVPYVATARLDVANPEYAAWVDAAVDASKGTGSGRRLRPSRR